MSRTTLIILATALSLFYMSPASAAPSLKAEASPLGCEVVSAGPSSVRLEFNLQAPRLRVLDDRQQGGRLWVDLPGSVADFDAEGPALPAFTRLLEVPEGCRVEVDIISSAEFTMDAEPAIPRDRMRRIVHSIEPKPLVDVGEPGWMRWRRMAPVAINPARYDAEEHCIYSVSRMVVEFNFIPEGNQTQSAPDPERYTSLAFQELFDILLLNPGNMPFIGPGGRVIRRGSYLIISDEILSETAAEFAAWKACKGFNVVLAPIITPGITFQEVKSYIQTAFDTWERPPEFILLLGDVNPSNSRIPAALIENPGYAGEIDVTDLPYVLLKGNDYFPDAFIGRISCTDQTITDARKSLGRIVDYEQHMDQFGVDNFNRATLFGGNFGEGNNPVLSPVETLRWLGERLRERGYGEVEEFYYRTGNDDISSAPIIQSINRGVNIVAYRGWADARGTHYPQFYKPDLDRLTNDQPLPVFTFFVCNTGDYGNTDHNPCFGEYAINRGTLRRANGAIAFLGPSDLHTSTRFNNPLLAGYYTGLMYQNVRTLGPLTLLAKMEVWRGFPNLRAHGESNFVEFYFHVYNILGDSELNLYFTAPTRLVVEAPERLAVGDTRIRWVVRRQGGGPVKGAVVHVSKGDETDYTMLTDADGIALMPVNLVTPGDLMAAVTAYQAVPYQDTISVENAARQIALRNVSASNPWGEDNRVMVGTPVDLMVTLANIGSEAAAGVTAVLTSALEEIEIIHNQAVYGDMAPGAAAQGQSAFQIQLPVDFWPWTSLPFELTIRDQANNVYRALFRLPAACGHLTFNSYRFAGGSISPGGSDDLILQVRNHGDLSLEGCRAELSSFDEAVVILDGAGAWDEIPVGEIRDNEANPFRIQIREQVHNGRRISLRSTFFDNQNRRLGLISFNITVGEVTAQEPLGPDGYGYYAYEDIDEGYASQPAFDWLELDPEFGGEGADYHPLTDDTTFTMDLPFPFTFYGEQYNVVSICSNGWFSFQDTWMWDFRNWGMPSPLGPHTMVAPFWDDLVGQMEAGNRAPIRVFTRYDQEERRFIIQWSRAVARTSVADITQTFQAILRDPFIPEMPDQDGDITFQYLEAEVVDRNEGNYATVGIEDWNHFRGLEVTYSNIYPEACAPIEPRRAIKFTTMRPDPYQGSRNENQMLPLSLALTEIYPNPFNAQTRISFSLPAESQVKLSLWDTNGRWIRDLTTGQFASGYHQMVFEAGSLPTGIFIVKLESGGRNLYRKALIIK